MAFRAGSSYFKVFKADGTEAEGLGAAPAAAAAPASDGAAAAVAAAEPAGPQEHQQQQEGNTVPNGGSNGSIKGSSGEDASAAWPPGRPSEHSLLPPLTQDASRLKPGPACR